MKAHPNVIASLLVMGGVGIVAAWLLSIFWLNGITKRQRGILRPIARLGFWATIFLNLALSAAWTELALKLIEKLEH